MDRYPGIHTPFPDILGTTTTTTDLKVNLRGCSVARLNSVEYSCVVIMQECLGVVLRPHQSLVVIFPLEVCCERSCGFGVGGVGLE